MAKLLIVDDDPAVAEVVSLVLRQEGYQTAVACSLAEAKLLIATTEINGAVIDVWLGRDDGLELATFLAAQRTGFPFIIMSGGGPGRCLETVTARADALGAICVLFKPFDDDELTAAVQKMLAAEAA